MPPLEPPAAPAPAPAAPAAPAPAAEPTAPSIDAARAKAEEFIKTLGQAPAAPAPPAPARNEDGTFKPKVDPVPPAPVAGDDGAAAPAPAEVDAGTGEPPAGEVAPAGEEFVEVTFPGRRPGEEMKLAFPKEYEEDAHRINNKLRAVEKLEAERNVVAREAQMVRETQFIIQSDPIGFVMETLDPTLKPEVVKHLLADPDVFGAVAQELEKFLDPNEREKMQLRLRADRADLREATRTRLAETRKGEQNALALRENVLRLAPDSWSPEQISTFMRDCLLDLSNYAQTAKVNAIDPSHIPVLLASRLRALGIDPVMAAARMADPTRAAGAPAPAVPKAPTAPRVTVKALQAAAQAAKDLGAVAPAGAGSLPAGSPVKPPAGSSLKDASRLARSGLGLAK